jgi:hypothetical protein
VQQGRADCGTERTIGRIIKDPSKDLLKELSAVPLILEEVAHSQTRLPARGNRQTAEEDGSES